MYRSPELGRVKSRLAGAIGDESALALYRWMGRRQLDALPREWEVEGRFTPNSAEAEMVRWLGGRPNWKAQGGGDLGERMARAARDAFELDECETVFFVGADCVSLDETALREAERALSAVDVVLGPSADGGYYLLGLSRRFDAVFDNISWGSNRVFSESIERIQALGATYSLLEERVDVDDWESLQSQKDFVDSRLRECL